MPPVALMRPVEGPNSGEDNPTVPPSRQLTFPSDAQSGTSDTDSPSNQSFVQVNIDTYRTVDKFGINVCFIVGFIRYTKLNQQLMQYCFACLTSP